MYGDMSTLACDGVIAYCYRMITRKQVRAARAVLRWGVRDLGDRAGISFNTITRFENGGDMLSANLDKVQRTLEGAGIEFLNTGRPGIQWTE